MYVNCHDELVAVNVKRADNKIFRALPDVNFNIPIEEKKINYREIIMTQTAGLRGYT